MVPGQDDLKHRVCLGPRYHELLAWFWTVEVEAWDWVYANFASSDRPARIFLVTGQTLTTEYAISHLETTSESCQISVDVGTEVPSLLEAGIVLGYGLTKVTASAGFQKVVAKGAGEHDLPLYSVFLKTIESAPTKRLNGINNTQRQKVFAWHKLCFLVPLN